MYMTPLLYGVIGFFLIVLASIPGALASTHKSYPKAFHVLMNILFIALELLALYFLAMPALGKIQLT